MEAAETFILPENLPFPAPRLAVGDAPTEAPARLAEWFPGQRFTVVSDANTHAALGASLADALSAHTHVLPSGVKPERALAESLAQLPGMLLAVGSGVVNDLCKYAAHLRQQPYAAFPTAASMNGYLSANASMHMAGEHRSLPAHLPAAVWVDMGVIGHAPPRLARAGLGDVLARSTAQADWLLSHRLHGTAYDARPFAWLLPLEARLLTPPLHLPTLMHALLLSGLGMTLCGESYPASQGEHMIVHAYEMAHGGTHLHGEAVAVATLHMARMQARALAKLPEAIATEIRAVMVPPERLEAALRAAGAPTTPEDIGWSATAFADAVARAPHTRDRYTFLSVK